MSSSQQHPTLYSMTGFASGVRVVGDMTLSMDIKSVNGKGLDIRIRVPSELDGLDLIIKKQISAMLERGSITVSMGLECESAGALVVDEQALRSLIGALAPFDIDVEAGRIKPASLDGLLQVRGVVKAQDLSISVVQRENLQAALLDLTTDTIDKLKLARAKEGGEIANALKHQVGQLADLAAGARLAVGPRGEAIQQRYDAALQRLSGVATEVEPERLAQELALIAVKLDITEELDRLDVHLIEAKNLLESGEPVGRKLDFLCQELHREANTLCSKAHGTALTRYGLDMKLLIDQFREQVQNIE